MSATPVGREVAHRLFAAEFDAASMSYSESDEERAPNYVVTPTGARVNRMFAVGVLTEVDTVNEDQLRARIVDPTGAFVVYAGQYQPEALTFLENASVPTFVAVTGKARTFEPADSDRVYTSIRPESISEVDAETRERWTVTTAERTLERIETFAGALALDARGDDLSAQLAAQGVSESLAAGIPKAIEHYGTTTAYLAAMETLATQALEVVTGDRDSVPSFDAVPSMAGPESPTRVASFEAVETVTDAADEGIESVEAEVEAELDAEDTEPEPTAEAESETVETDEAVVEDSEPEVEEQVVESEPEIDTEPPEEDATGTVPEAEPVDAADATATQQAEPADDVDDELGDFEEDDDLEDFEPGEFDEMYEMDDEERKEVEEEFGTEFSTGSEVGPAGEAGIEVPEPEDVEEVAEPEPEAETDDDSAADDADVDLEDAVLTAMRDLDDGDGADREAIIAAVIDEHGVSVEAVEDAIQDALMDGQCYEPDESTLTAI
ncbi:RPA family protein [Haladaptatus sp. CMSO5]|uniref:RPA family protein n=1 Tax=Haladaptatus sp. CMSO5 TaxID=3120514 RepID=UPI002FCE0AC8